MTQNNTTNDDAYWMAAFFTTLTLLAFATALLALHEVTATLAVLVVVAGFVLGYGVITRLEGGDAA